MARTASDDAKQRQGIRNPSMVSSGSNACTEDQHIICLHIRNVTLPLSTQLLKPFDGARLPRDGREQPRRKQFRRPQKPPLVSPSSLPFQFHPPSSVRPHYLPRDMTTTIIKCVARAAPSRTNDHRNCTMGFRGEMASLRTLRSSTPQDIEQRDQKLLLPRANCSPLFSHAMRVIARRQNGDGCRVAEGYGTGN